MKLISNECVNCRRVVGYVTLGALLIPTMCVLCAHDREVMKEWGHRIDKAEKPTRDVLLDYRSRLNDIKLLS